MFARTCCEHSANVRPPRPDPYPNPNYITVVPKITFTVYLSAEAVDNR